jgi:collectin sub-family member 11
MTNTRLDAGFSGVSALLMTCLACTSLQDLSSYSAGSSDSAAAPGFQPPDANSNEEALTPTPDAGTTSPPAAEAQNPSDVPLIAPDSVDDADDCTGPGEFTVADGTSCYQLDDTLSAWRDARDLCQAWGGDLAKVESVEENTLLGERSSQDVWLGASDFEDEGNFRWFDGDDVDPEGSWAPAQPDNFEGRENCLELRAIDDQWNDVPCMSQKFALCERALDGEGAAGP